MKDSIGEEAQTLRQACGMFSTSNNTTGFFLAISRLITIVDSHDHVVRINIRQQPSWRWDLERAQMRYLPARPLLPTAKKFIQVQKQSSHTILDKSDECASIVQMSPQVTQPGGPQSSPIEVYFITTSS